jgi:carbon-monoxide dehydrogenase small subunit
MTLTFILNGEDVSATIRTGDRLVDVLRDGFHLLAAKADCRKGTCGKCLVLINGRLVPSCMVPAFRIRGKEIVTLEGFMQTDEYGDIKKGIEEAGLETCGFCDSGVILSIASLLEARPRPSREDILEYLSVVQCRCSDPESTLRAAEASAEARSRRLYNRGRQ